MHAATTSWNRARTLAHRAGIEEVANVRSYLATIPETRRKILDTLNNGTIIRGHNARHLKNLIKDLKTTLHNPTKTPTTRKTTTKTRTHNPYKTLHAAKKFADTHGGIDNVLETLKMLKVITET